MGPVGTLDFEDPADAPFRELEDVIVIPSGADVSLTSLIGFTFAAAAAPNLLAIFKSSADCADGASVSAGFESVNAFISEVRSASGSFRPSLPSRCFLRSLRSRLSSSSLSRLDDAVVSFHFMPLGSRFFLDSCRAGDLDLDLERAIVLLQVL